MAKAIGYGLFLDMLFETIKSKFGALDIVFANAGIANFVSLEQVSEEYYSKMMDINVKGLYFTVQKLFRF